MLFVLSQDGAILEESDTNPYGDIRYGSNNNDITTYYGFHERNDTTGLIDMEARMYDPSNLQFSAPDPISLYNPTAYLSDPSQMHMYAYAKGNPVRYNDPTGMASKSVKSVVSSAKSLATKAVSAVTSSSAFKSVTARFGGGGGSSAPTANKPMQAPNYNTGVMHGPILEGRTSLASPVIGYEPNSLFKAKRDCTPCSKVHGGTDYPTPIGTPVYAMASGTVVRADSLSKSFGSVVILDHGVSSKNASEKVHTVYAHGSSLNVTVGQNVETGDVVMLSGDSGNSTGPHLHQETVASPFNIKSNDFYYKDKLQYRYAPDELSELLK